MQKARDTPTPKGYSAKHSAISQIIFLFFVFTAIKGIKTSQRPVAVPA